MDQHLVKDRTPTPCSLISATETRLSAYTTIRENPTEVPEQFKYMLSYSKAVPKYLPDFYNYLSRRIPRSSPPAWTTRSTGPKQKFGLKPTLRAAHVVTMRKYRGSTSIPRAIAEKQPDSSHYFETARDLTLLASPKRPTPKRPGFYLIMAMGSK